MATFNGSATFHTGLTFSAAKLVTYGGSASFFTGLSFATAQRMSYNGIPVPASVGITVKAGGVFNWSGASSSSIGPTITASGTVIRGGMAAMSVGLTFSAKGALVYLRGSAAMSIGLTFGASGKHTHAGKSVMSLGLTFSSVASTKPATVKMNSILLFEATDIGAPTAFDAVVSRDYSLVYADTTVNSYPKPYTLLN